MQDWLPPYGPAIAALGVTAGLLLLQILVADVASIRARHVPGTPVEADHAHFLFRAVRAHANTNESIAAFTLLVLSGVLAGASPRWINLLAWVYVGARVAHMLFYYAGVQIARSLSFALAMAALVGMLVVGVAAWG